MMKQHRKFIENIFDQHHQLKSMNLKIGEAKLLNQIYLSSFLLLFLRHFQCFVFSVRDRLKRQHSASIISPQRPCTAVSSLSKSRPDSSSILVNETHKDDQPTPTQDVFTFVCFQFIFRTDFFSRK